MLLTNLIASFQNQYADIQAQIEELQEQQRKIQAHLQQLGSVESQMVSAVQMLQEAIGSINEVCPDQLAEYQGTVTGLFSVPIAALNPSQPEAEPEIETTPNPEPTQPNNVVNFPSVATVISEIIQDNIKPETESTPNPEPLFKFRISHYGDYITYWKGENDEVVTQMFKDLKIRPRDKKPSDGYNPFDGNGVVLYGYLTSKAFAKVEDKAEWLDAGKLD
jgi:hypothetical protein